MAGTIDPKSFIPGIKQLETGIKSVVTTLELLNANLKEIDKQAKKNQQTQKQTIKNSQKSKEQLDVLAKTEKEIINIENKYTQTLAKTSAERTLQAKKLERLKQLKQEQNKRLREEVKLQGSATDSLVRKRAELNKLTRQYDRGSAALRTKLNPQITRLTNEISAAEQATGRHQRNVGNYGDALNSLPGPLGRASNGVRMFGAQLKALLLNPVVALIAAIAGAFMLLFKAMKRSEEGANELNVLFSKLRSILDVVMDRVGDLAIRIFKAFKDPQQAIKDLWEVIKINLVNRIKGVADLFVGLGNIAVNSMKLAGESIANVFRRTDKDLTSLNDTLKQSAKDMGRAFIQIQTGLDTDQQDKFIKGLKGINEEANEEYKLSGELEKRKQALIKLERDFIVEKSKLAAKIADAREAAANENIELEKRLELNRNAVKLTDQLYSKEVEFAKIRAEIAAEEVAMGHSTTEQLNELETLKAAQFEKDREWSLARKKLFAEERTLVSRLNSKAVDDVQKTLDEEVKLIDDYLLEKINKEIEADKKIIESHDSVFEKEKADHDARLAMIQERLNMTAEIGNQVFDITGQFLEADRLRAENYRTEQDAIAQQQADKEIQLAGNNASLIESINDRLTNQKAQNEKEYNDKLKEINRKQAISDKVQAIFNAGINTAVAVTKTLANPVLAGIIAALGSIQIAAIAATPIPKFAKGVINKTDSGLGIVGEGLYPELVKTPDGQSQIVDKETMMYLPKGSDVIPLKSQDQIAMAGGMSQEHFDRLINEQRLTRKAIANQPQHINHGSYYEVKTKMSSTKYLDDYYKR